MIAFNPVKQCVNGIEKRYAFVGLRDLMCRLPMVVDLETAVAD
jgi:hypothetical protein